jgi:hypothetical protein
MFFECVTRKMISKLWGGEFYARFKVAGNGEVIPQNAVFTSGVIFKL